MGEKYRLVVDRVSPGPGLLSIVVIASTLMLGAIVAGSLASLVASSMLVSMAVGLWRIFAESLGGMEAYVDASPQRLHAGRSLEVSLRLANRSYVPMIMHLRLAGPYNQFYGERGFSPEETRMALVLRPRSEATVGTIFEALRRGRYPIRDVEAVVSDAMGVAVAKGRLVSARPLEILIMPRVEVIEASHHAYRAVLRIQGQGLRTRRPGYGTVFAGHRDYQPGDDARLIDWKVYARLRRLVVKMQEAEEEVFSLIVVDSTRSMMLGPPDRSPLDAALSLALSFYEYSTRRGTRTTMAAYNEELVWLVRDPRLIPVLLAEIYPAARSDLYSAYADLWDKARSDVKHLQLLRVLREAVSTNPRRMRILLISDLPVVSSPPAFHTYLENMVSALRSRRHEVIMVAPVSPLFELRARTGIDMAGAERVVKTMMRSYSENRRLARKLGYAIYSVTPSTPLSLVVMRVLKHLSG